MEIQIAKAKHVGSNSRTYIMVDLTGTTIYKEGQAGERNIEVAIY